MTTEHTRRTPRLAGAVLLSVSLLVWAGGCEERGAAASASQKGAAPAQPGEHDEHDHAEEAGHDHGEAEHTDEVTLTPEAVARYGVKVEEARLHALRPTLIAPARVAFNSEAMAHVGSPLRGRAVEINAKLGDTVGKGDPLAVIESPELGQAQAEFLQKRTAAEAAGPQVDLAKAAWDRARALLERSEGISLTDVQKREAEYKAAVAAQKSAQAAAVAAENTLHLLGMPQAAVGELVATGEIAPCYTIRAAIGGQVVQREITLGEMVSPDRDAIMVIADLATLWVLADVPESRLAAVAPGSTAWVMLGSAGDAGEPHRYEGRVAFVSPMVDPTTRTAEVRIELPTDAGVRTVRPGMFAQVEIAASAPGGGELAPQVAVPESAVQTVEGGPAVFVPVPDEPNTFQRRAVVVGPAVGGVVPVISGLAAGDRFVSAGSFILKAELGKGSAAHEH